MDHIRPKAKKTMTRRGLGALAGVVVLGLVISLWTLDFGTRRISREKLQIDVVQLGDLDIKVGANGVLLPKQVEWVAAQVEGRVSAIHRYAGDRVEAGQLLLEFNNPALVNAAEEAMSALEEARASQVSYRVNLENELLNQKSQALQAKFAYASAKLKLDAETELREKSSIIADIDYRRTQLAVEQLLAISQIEQERLAKSQTNMAAQLAAKQAQVEQRAKVLDRAKAHVAALQATSSMSGVLQKMDLKVGQRLLPGDEIAQVARQDDLYAKLRVLARQASDILVGQKVIVDTRNGTVEGIVSRMDPAVVEGTVAVDVNLQGELPKGSRPELQVEGTIYIAQLRNVLFVTKPSYSRPNDSAVVYRLEHDKAYARRITVQLGRASVSHIEILDGLEVGDQIILSDSTDWQAHDRILIN